ncbi:hypothetical protein SK128_027385 [Halocaridina rubra]|uniref:Uncharacterized protein n=1 Tax=Halocaridina rubra TaxID=373956 RepID=A0AAN9A3E3_HALRR
MSENVMDPDEVCIRHDSAPYFRASEIQYLALEDDLPCTVRILCELETAARTAMEDALPDTVTLHEGPVDERGQTVGDGDRVEGTLLEIDHIDEFHHVAVHALYP